MILIRKVKEEFGWLGNMSPHAVNWRGETFRTSEAMFQSLRFQDESIRKLIRDQKSPMSAKMIAKKHRCLMNVEPMSKPDLQNMRVCLEAKIEQHSALKERLLATGEEWIVEDCSKRQHGSGMFWGAASIANEWKGENWLGMLWMQLRAELRVDLLTQSKRGV